MLRNRHSTRRCGRSQHRDCGLQLREARLEIWLPVKEVVDLRGLRLQLLEDVGGVGLGVLMELLEVLLERWFHGGDEGLPRLDAPSGFQIDAAGRVVVVSDTRMLGTRSIYSRYKA